MLAQSTSADPVQSAAPVLFYAFAALTCLSAWAIVLSQNIIRMSVYLMLTLGGVAGLYFMLSAEFLAAIQLIVYAGGTLILIVFGIMLTSKNPFARFSAEPWEMAVGVLIGGTIAGMLILAWVHTFDQLAIADSPMVQRGNQVEAIGRLMLSTYLVPFEVAAVLLLVVMIGAAYMARRRVEEEVT